MAMFKLNLSLLNTELPKAVGFDIA